MTDDTDEPDDLPSTTLDAAAYPDPDDLVDEEMRRIRVHGSLVTVDRATHAFDGFLIHWWRGVYVVLGSGQRALGTFASIKAAIGQGRIGPRSAGAGDGCPDPSA